MAFPGRGDGRLWVPTHLAIVLGLILMLVILYGLAVAWRRVYPRWLGGSSPSSSRP